VAVKWSNEYATWGMFMLRESVHYAKNLAPQTPIASKKKAGPQAPSPQNRHRLKNAKTKDASTEHAKKTEKP